MRTTLQSVDLRFARVESGYPERGALQVHSGGERGRVKPQMASVFDDCCFDVVSVASNHAMDWGEDAKRSLIAKAVITRDGVEKTSFLPVLIDRQLRPEPLRQHDPRFADTVQYMEWASEGFPHTYAVVEDEVVVRAGA